MFAANVDVLWKKYVQYLSYLLICLHLFGIRNQKLVSTFKKDFIVFVKSAFNWKMLKSTFNNKVIKCTIFIEVVEACAKHKANRERQKKR